MRAIVGEVRGSCHSENRCLATLLLAASARTSFLIVLNRGAICGGNGIRRCKRGPRRRAPSPTARPGGLSRGIYRSLVGEAGVFCLPPGESPKFPHPEPRARRRDPRAPLSAWQAAIFGQRDRAATASQKRPRRNWSAALAPSAVPFPSRNLEVQDKRS